ncbi:unnamed protein product [Bursaphelenchus xylophilus]|uniref:(pine wood nematode) hypothetical protein n=1 Tax=Bursaphelenchus xylophilus TaxID=6326 RepID=A0A1I7RZA7_BURXY|nr:unnamed protein product [Bursaphelenchus xylophilus]CAG9106671.1 unnamed protein product [Bursaphelenchus xylophilus]
MSKTICEDCSPVVFILGFLNSKEFHYATLKKFYEKYTNDVTVYVSKLYNQQFWPSGDKGDDFIERIYFPKIKEKPNAPVIFHMFSQNGGLQFYYLWHKLNEEEKKQIKGLIFDGSPGTFSWHPTYYINARFFMLPKEEKTSLNYWFYHVPTHIPRSILYSFLIFFGQYDQYSERMAEYDLPHNQLFIHSKIDRLVRPKLIKKFAEQQVQHGKSVEVKEFPDGIHCMHFLTNRKEYHAATERFLKRCIGEDVYNCHIGKAKL